MTLSDAGRKRKKASIFPSFSSPFYLILISIFIFFNFHFLFFAHFPIIQNPLISDYLFSFGSGIFLLHFQGIWHLGFPLEKKRGFEFDKLGKTFGGFL
ncbi:hypothetical protein M5689_005311 [Euphorbia peplus]|nr:hypothetical protein M5689_005311 [Euphorbia peplus]